MYLPLRRYGLMVNGMADRSARACRSDPGEKAFFENPCRHFMDLKVMVVFPLKSSHELKTPSFFLCRATFVFFCLL
jgi:hypothetical protein